MHFKKRNLIAVLALTVVTFGIYYLFWLYFTRKEIVASSGNPKSIPAYWVLFAPFLIGLLLLFIPLLILGAAGDSNDTFANILSSVFGIVGVLLFLAGFGVIFWWYYMYCKALSAVTKGMDLTTSYVLFIVTCIFGVGPVWQLLAQNDMNHAADGHSTNGHTINKSDEPPYPTYPSEPNVTAAPHAPVTPHAPAAPHEPTHHQPLPHAAPEEPAAPAAPQHQSASTAFAPAEPAHHAAPVSHPAPSHEDNRTGTPSVNFHAPQPSQRQNENE